MKIGPLGEHEPIKQLGTPRVSRADMFRSRSIAPNTNTDNSPVNQAKQRKKLQPATRPTPLTPPQPNLSEGADDTQARLEGHSSPTNELNQFSHEYAEPPLSRAEQLLKSHPDIKVLRSEYTFGRVELTQKVYAWWRNIVVDVKHEEGSQRHNPSVIISAYETPSNANHEYNSQMRRYGLTTLVKVHVEDDERVTPEVGYKEREQYPLDFTREQIISYFEVYSFPIPAQEIVTTAQIGLEMLKAYREASFDQKMRILNEYDSWDNIIGEQQIYAGQPGREDMDKYIAEALPLFSNALRQKGISYNNSSEKGIYALNALNKVTDAMLPQEMPPAPKNRRERARRRPRQ